MKNTIKNFWLAVFAFVLILPAVFVLSACEQHIHSFNEEWTSNDFYHWHSCIYTGCDEKSDKVEHTFDSGVKSSETEKVFTCTICGKQVTVKSQSQQHEHTFDDGEITIQPTCTQNGEITYTCSGCGETKTELVKMLGHDYSVLVSSQVFPTCLASGTTAKKKCSRCSKTIGGDVISALGHNYQNGTCSRCGDIEQTQHTHSWQQTSKYVAPTNHQNGKNATYICNGCQQTKGGEILNMLHDVQSKPATVSTCITNGRTSGKYCEDCGEYLTGGEVLALDKTNHESTEMITKNVKQPTCEQKGYTGDVCFACCGQVYSVGVDLGMTDHDWVKISDDITVTCLTDGVKAIYECSYCGQTKGGEKTPAVGHYFSVEESPYIYPTCVYSGKNAMYSCIRCSETTGGETIPALGHSKGIPTFSYSQRSYNTHYIYYNYYCVRCNSYLSRFNTYTNCSLSKITCTSTNFEYKNGAWYCKECGSEHSTTKPTQCAKKIYYCTKCQRKNALDNISIDTSVNSTSLVDKFCSANDCESTYLRRYNGKIEKFVIDSLYPIYLCYDNNFFESEVYTIKLVCEYFSRVFETINPNYRFEPGLISSTTGYPIADNQIYISKENLADYKSDEVDSYGYASGLTYVSFRKMSNGDYEITKPKIIMNSTVFTASNKKVDFYEVLVHELLHCLGLADVYSLEDQTVIDYHTQMQDTIMSAPANRGYVKYIGSNDYKLLCALYGNYDENSLHSYDEKISKYTEIYGKNGTHTQNYKEQYNKETTLRNNLRNYIDKNKLRLVIYSVKQYATDVYEKMNLKDSRGNKYEFYMDGTYKKVDYTTGESTILTYERNYYFTTIEQNVGLAEVSGTYFLFNTLTCEIIDYMTLNS